jgi:hypothetical protein
VGKKVRWACCATCGDPVRGVKRTGQAHRGHYLPTECIGDIKGGYQWMTYDMDDPTDRAIIEKLRSLE